MNRYMVLISVGFCLLAVFFAGCGKGTKGSKNEKDTIMSTQTGDVGSMQGNLNTIVGATEGRELTASVASEEEAEKIADTYGIELVSFSYGVAEFHTDEDPMTVINRGKKNGWPVLSLNAQAVAFDGSGQLDELEKTDENVH